MGKSSSPRCNFLAAPGGGTEKKKKKKEKNPGSCGECEVETRAESKPILRRKEKRKRKEKSRHWKP
jgi:ribosomal protein L34E